MGAYSGASEQGQKQACRLGGSVLKLQAMSSDPVLPADSSFQHAELEKGPLYAMFSC